MMKTTLFLLVFLISTSQIQLQQAYAGTVLTSISRTLKIINLDDLTDLERRRYLLNQKAFHCYLCLFLYGTMIYNIHNHESL